MCELTVIKRHAVLGGALLIMLPVLSVAETMDDFSSLMQLPIRNVEEVKSTAAQASSQIPGPTVYLDGKTPLSTMLSPVKKGHAVRYLFSYPVKANGITLNETHIMMPMYKKIQSTYFRKVQGMKIEEIGVANQKYFPQKNGAVFGKNVTVGVAEKMLGYWRNKLDITALKRAQTSSNVTAPVNVVEKKNTLVILAAGASGMGTQILAASGIPDKMTMEKIREGTLVPDRIGKKAIKLRRKLLKFFKETVPSTEPKFSFASCLHWDDVQVDEIKGVVTFPKKKRLSTYRGTQASAPFTAMDFLQGVSFWTYHEPTGRVELHFSASIHSHWPDPKGADSAPAMVYYGSYDGDSEIGLQPAAFNPVPPSEMAYQLSMGASLYPDDYSYLFQPRSALCQQSKIDTIKSNLQMLPMILGKMAMNDPNASGAFAAYVADLLPCAAPFVKPAGINSSAFNIYDAAVLSHAAMEVPIPYQMDIIAGNDWWDIDVTLVPLAEGLKEPGLTLDEDDFDD